jgi:cystathionine beta-lyase
MSGAIARAIELTASTPHAWMPQQFDNPANIDAHVQTTAVEIAADFPSGIDALITPQTRVVYLESPGSYTFEIQDVPAICRVARARGVISMIDNAWASPVMARPFDWGVDVSLLPLTKYWGGHADLLMGAAIVREEHGLPLWQAVRQLGICVGGDDAFLVLRGLRTAQVRMRQHEATALTVARWLEGRPEVASVLHPALPSHPQHALFKRDFLGSSGLFSFELKAATPEQLAALCERRHHFKIGYSWGGFESLIMPAKISALRTVRAWTGGPLVRLHCGLEDPQDLINDLEQGIVAMAAAG